MNVVRRCISASCDAGLWCVDKAITIIGPLLAVLATGLILMVVYVYFTEFLPILVEKYGGFHSELLTLLGLWLVCNLIYNYMATIWFGPGSTPDVLTEEQKFAMLDDPELDEGMHYRYCKRCRKIKPMRTHHCSICNVCVPKMDHHCPWVNTCVGHRNHKHFLLFLFYMCTASLFYLTADVQSTINALTGKQESALFMISTVMTFSAFIATGLFLIWNLFLLATNQSTIEFYGNHLSREKRRYTSNPYNVGVFRNIEEVFGRGTTWWSWCLPSRAPPVGDGVIYPMNNSLNSSSSTSSAQQHAASHSSDSHTPNSASAAYSWRVRNGGGNGNGSEMNGHSHSHSAAHGASSRSLEDGHGVLQL